MAATGPATPQQDGQRDREARLHENHENHCLVAQKGRRKRRLPPALSPAPQALRRAHTWGGGGEPPRMGRNRPHSRHAASTTFTPSLGSRSNGPGSPAAAWGPEGSASRSLCRAASRRARVSWGGRAGRRMNAGGALRPAPPVGSRTAARGTQERHLATREHGDPGPRTGRCARVFPPSSTLNRNHKATRRPQITS